MAHPWHFFFLPAQNTNLRSVSAPTWVGIKLPPTEGKISWRISPITRPGRSTMKYIAD